ncbi:MAG: hypothetical protein IT458_05665 [Planctomycetes bacterium]|nr:hypothetical protein [Planctomycetota bacterium]
MVRSSQGPARPTPRLRVLLAALLLLAQILLPGLHHVLTPHDHCGGHAACEHGGAAIATAGDAHDPHVADACPVCDLLLAGRHWLPGDADFAPHMPDPIAAPGPALHASRIAGTPRGQPPARGPPSWS